MERFSFQTLREKDRLIYSAIDAKREEKQRKYRDTNNQRNASNTFRSRSARSHVEYLKPAPQKSRSIIAKDEVRFTELSYVQDKCDRLYSDILQLEKEVQPLRSKRRKLESHILSADQREVLYNQKYAPDERQVNWEIMQHATTKDVISIRNEKKSLDQEKKEISQWIEPNGNEKFFKSVEKIRKKLLEERKRAKEIEGILNNVYQDINEFSLSSTFVDVQEQRSKMDELRNLILEQIDMNERLKNEKSEIKHGRGTIGPEIIDETDEVSPLLQELRQKKSKIEKLKQDYKELQKRHKMEIERVKTMSPIELAQTLDLSDDELPGISYLQPDSNENIDNCTIYVGFFDTEVEKNGMNTMFEQFGSIKRIEIFKAMYDGDEYYCSTIEYENHKDANLALQSMDGIPFRGVPMIVTWSDQSEKEKSRPKPPDAPSGQAPRRKRTDSKQPSSVKWRDPIERIYHE